MSSTVTKSLKTKYQKNSMLFNAWSAYECVRNIGTYLPYCGVAPQRPGTQTKYINTTILRSVGFRPKEAKIEEMQVQGKPFSKVLDSHATPAESRKYKVSATYDRRLVKYCAKKFVEDNLSFLACELPGMAETLKRMKASEISTGGQTFNGVLERNTTAKTAYNYAISVLKINNLKSDSDTLYQLLIDFSKIFELEKVKVIKYVKERIDKDEERGSKLKKGKKRYVYVEKEKVVEVTLYEFLDKHFFKFSSMIKHGERRAKDGRAIVSPGMYMRGFLKVTETLSKFFLERVETSATPMSVGTRIGKMTKLLAEIMALGDVTGSETGDHTKYNEALSVSGFGVMFKVMRDELLERGFSEGILEPLRIAWVTCSLMEHKRIELGRGFGTAEKYESLFTFLREQSMDDMNMIDRHCVWSESNNTVQISGIMFMGMMNMSSTLVQVVVHECARDFYRDKMKVHMRTMHSSDDYMSHASVSTADMPGETREEKVMNAKRSMRTAWSFKEELGKGAGVNQSRGKTSWIEPAGLFEMTSVYFADQRTVNIAQELPAVTVAGIGIEEDVSIAQMTLKSALQQDRVSLEDAVLMSRIISKSFSAVYKLPLYSEAEESGAPDIFMEKLLYVPEDIKPFFPQIFGEAKGFDIFDLLISPQAVEVAQLQGELMSLKQGTPLTEMSEETVKRMCALAACYGDTDFFGDHQKFSYKLANGITIETNQDYFVMPSIYKHAKGPKVNLENGTNPLFDSRRQRARAVVKVIEEFKPLLLSSTNRSNPKIETVKELLAVQTMLDA